MAGKDGGKPSLVVVEGPAALVSRREEGERSSELSKAQANDAWKRAWV
jgi:hypothetical protein